MISFGTKLIFSLLSIITLRAEGPDSTQLSRFCVPPRGFGLGQILFPAAEGLNFLRREAPGRGEGPVCLCGQELTELGSKSDGYSVASKADVLG